MRGRGHGGGATEGEGPHRRRSHRGEGPQRRRSHGGAWWPLTFCQAMTQLCSWCLWSDPAGLTLSPESSAESNPAAVSDQWDLVLNQSLSSCEAESTNNIFNVFNLSGPGVQSWYFLIWPNMNKTAELELFRIRWCRNHENISNLLLVSLYDRLSACMWTLSHGGPLKVLVLRGTRTSELHFITVHSVWTDPRVLRRDTNNSCDETESDDVSVKSEHDVK